MPVAAAARVPRLVARARSARIVQLFAVMPRPMPDSPRPRTDEATHDVARANDLRAHVREQPWLSFAAAAGAGALLGGVAFSRMGRLAFAAAAGFVAHELWHREGRLAVDEVLARFAPERGRRARSVEDDVRASGTERGPVQP
jgi:hypothetical protein